MSEAAYKAMCRALEIDSEEKRRVNARVDAHESRLAAFEKRVAELEAFKDTFTNAALAGEQQFDPTTIRTRGGIGHGPVSDRKPPHA